MSRSLFIFILAVTLAFYAIISYIRLTNERDTDAKNDNSRIIDFKD
jgi:hypothetical protein